MKFLFTCFVGLCFISATASGYTITTFNPTTFIATGASPTASTITSLNNAVGLNNATIENFEDDTLIDGLTLNMQGIANAAPSTFGSTSGIAAWNGNTTTVPSVQSFDAIFNYAPGANFFGIGVGDVESDVRLVVNGEDLGLVRSFANYNRQLDNAREIYIRVDREAGDSAITEVVFTKTGIGDGLFFDHLAVDNAVPEPGTFISLLLALTSAYFLRSRS